MQGFNEGAVDYLQKPLDVNVTSVKEMFLKALFLPARLAKFTTRIRKSKQATGEVCFCCFTRSKISVSFYCYHSLHFAKE